MYAYYDRYNEPVWFTFLTLFSAGWRRCCFVSMTACCLTNRGVQGDRARSATLPWTGVVKFWRFKLWWRMVHGVARGAFEEVQKKRIPVAECGPANGELTPFWPQSWVPPLALRRVSWNPEMMVWRLKFVTAALVLVASSHFVSGNHQGAERHRFCFDFSDSIWTRVNSTSSSPFCEF